MLLPLLPARTVSVPYIVIGDDVWWKIIYTNAGSKQKGRESR